MKINKFKHFIESIYPQRDIILEKNKRDNPDEYVPDNKITDIINKTLKKSGIKFSLYEVKGGSIIEIEAKFSNFDELLKIYETVYKLSTDILPQYDVTNEIALSGQEIIFSFYL
jgi:sRNA-binding regulator protein Hfq